MSEHFRLVSANLASGKADPRRFRELVEHLGADVVAVQELAATQAAALAQALPFGRLEPGSHSTGMGIALRKPGSASHVPLPHRGGWVANFTPDGAPAAVEILNVHILAPHIMPTWRTAAARRAQFQALETYLSATPRQCRIVVGDLNSTSLWPGYRRLRRWLGDAAVEVAGREGRRPSRTWRPHRRLPRLLRIDHVLTTGLTAHQVRVLPIDGSDHSAVMVELSVGG